MTARESAMDIGEVVRLSGLPPSTLHVWEQHGLIKPSGRNGLRRQYDKRVLDRIATIILFQQGGFTLGEIASLLSPGAFDKGKDQFVRKLDELELKRARLDAAITGLEHALSCKEPSPLECPGFRSMVAETLPVARDDATRKKPPP